MEHTIVPIKANHSLAVCALYYTAKGRFKNILEFAKTLDFSREHSEDLDEVDSADSNDETIMAFKSNNKIYWSLRVKGTMFAIECHEYVSWERFKRDTKPLTEKFHAEYGNDVHSIGFYVKDVFQVSLKNNSEFPLEKLFNGRSKYIVPAFFTAKYPPAYSYYEFTERDTDGTGLFKFDSIMVGIKAFLYDEGLTFELENQQVSPLLERADRYMILPVVYYDKLDKYHSRNKYLLTDILIDKIQDRIGLSSDA